MQDAKDRESVPHPASLAQFTSVQTTNQTPKPETPQSRVPQNPLLSAIEIGHRSNFSHAATILEMWADLSPKEQERAFNHLVRAQERSRHPDMENAFDTLDMFSSFIHALAFGETAKQWRTRFGLNNKEAKQLRAAWLLIMSADRTSEKRAQEEIKAEGAMLSPSEGDRSAEATRPSVTLLQKKKNTGLDRLSPAARQVLSTEVDARDIIERFVRMNTSTRTALMNYLADEDAAAKHPDEADHFEAARWFSSFIVSDRTDGLDDLAEWGLTDKSACELRDIAHRVECIASNAAAMRREQEEGLHKPAVATA